MMIDLRHALSLQARRTLAVVGAILAAVTLAVLLGAGCDTECAEPSCYEAAAEVCGGVPAATFVCAFDEEAGCNVLVAVECDDGTVLGS